MLLRFLGGFFMALADSVPGVSGGTIAYIMGIYDEFIGSLHNIASKDGEKRKKAIFFLMKLGCGWVLGMLLAAMVIGSIFEKQIYALSSLFVGFILASIPLIVIEEKENLSLKGKWKWLNIFWGIGGFALVLAVTFLSSNVLPGVESFKFGEFSPLQAVYIFVVAAFAICAMVLPGISGSTIMLIFGIYGPVMEAIKGFIQGVFSLDFSYFLGLFVFGLGVITGICSIVRALKVALEKHRGAITYFIIGMMVSSIYAVIMGPASPSLEVPKEPLSFGTFSILWFVVGVAIIAGLQFMKIKFVRKENSEK